MNERIDNDEDGLDLADFAQYRPGLHVTLPAESPLIVAIGLLLFCNRTVNDMLNHAMLDAMELQQEIRPRLKQLSGKLTVAIELLEGKFSLSPAKGDPS